MTRLAIKGHASRGKEVIELLEMLGGKNGNHCCGAFINRIYFINENGYIESCDRMYHLEYHQLTLEEFLGKFPYRVGDVVLCAESCMRYLVIGARWDDGNNEVLYKLQSGLVQSIGWKACNLRPYEEQQKEKDTDRKFKETCHAAYHIAKNKSRIWNPYYSSCSHWGHHDLLWVDPIFSLSMNEKLKEKLKEKDMSAENNNMDNRQIVFQEDAQEKTELVLGDDFEVVVEGGKTYVVRKKPQYPKTYEECCKALKMPADESYIDIDVPLDYNKVLISFTKLLICRDAYWKIAGDWKPDWEETDSTKYILYTDKSEIKKNHTGWMACILAFPTKKMRDTFYENFKDLINECRKLLD